MTRKEMRIMEIMEEQEVSMDVAEQLFYDELEERFSECETDNLDVLEMMYETEERKRRKVIHMNNGSLADIEALEGYTIERVEPENETDGSDGVCIYAYREVDGVKIRRAFSVYENGNCYLSEEYIMEE